MPRAALLLAVVVAFSLGGGDAPAHISGGTVVAFVAVESRSELVAFELSPTLLGRIAIASPQNVTTTGVLRYLLVTSPQAGTVSLVDSYTLRVAKVFRGFGRPLDVAVEGWNAYVTDARRNQLVVIDLVRRKIAAVFLFRAVRRTSPPATSRSSRMRRRTRT